jgi:hypothetical protein
VVLMLIVAALLEGFGRQLINETPGRLGVGLFMLFVWLSYFFLFRRDVDGAGHEAGTP